MLTYIGMALVGAGIAGAALMHFGLFPALMMRVPLDFTGCVIVGLAGAGLMYFNRRPGN